MTNGGGGERKSRGSQRFFGNVLLIASLLISGCTAVGLQQKTEVPRQKAQEIIHELLAKEARIQTLKGLFRVSITGSILPVSKTFPGVVFYTRPDSIRLKGFTPVGGTFFQFVRDGEDYRLVIPTSGRFANGKIQDLAQAGDMGHVVQLSLRAMDAVLGKMKGLNLNETKLYEDDRGYRLDMEELGGDKHVGSEVALTRIWVNKERYDIEYIEYLDEEEDILMSIDCQDFRNVSSTTHSSESAIQLPFHIRAEDDRLSGSVTLMFQEIVANAAL